MKMILIVVAVAVMVFIGVMVANQGHQEQREKLGAAWDWEPQQQRQDIREFRRARRETERGAEIRQAVPFIEVEWQPLLPLSPKLYRSIEGIFVERCGAIRVVDIHPRAMQGMRVWLSEDDGKTWRIEHEFADASRDLPPVLGREKTEVIFASRGGRLFADWPAETKGLLRTAYRREYKHKRRGGHFSFNRDPNYPDRIVFAVPWQPGGGGPAAVWVSLDNGKRWTLINEPHSARANNIYPDIFSAAIKSYEDNILLYVGLAGGGENIVQFAMIDFVELKEQLLVKK